jgi:hypothetical protein
LGDKVRNVPLFRAVLVHLLAIMQELARHPSMMRREFASHKLLPLLEKFAKNEAPRMGWSHRRVTVCLIVA